MLCALIVKLLVAASYCQPVVRDLRTEHASDLAQRAATCVAVAYAAEHRGVPVDLALAVAWNESRFDYYAVGGSGEVGPLQALPKYWCRRKPCNRIAAGLRALSYHLDRQPTHMAALTRYNGCKSNRYGAKVLRTVNRFYKSKVSK